MLYVFLYCNYTNKFFKNKMFLYFFVGLVGLEPTRLAALVPKTSVSTIPPQPVIFYITEYWLCTNT